jgi:hypothetical protein
MAPRTDTLAIPWKVSTAAAKTVTLNATKGVERGSLRSKGRVGSAAHSPQTRPLPPTSRLRRTGREARPTTKTNHSVERGSLRSKGRVGSAAHPPQTRPLPPTSRLRRTGREARPTTKTNHSVERGSLRSKGRVAVAAHRLPKKISLSHGKSGTGRGQNAQYCPLCLISLRL